MIQKKLNQLLQIDQLIRLKRTGNANEFSRKIGISRRHLYNRLEELKDLDLDISYDRNIQSYFYTRPYKIDIIFNIRELTEEEIISKNSIE